MRLNIKKNFLILFFILLIVFLSACGKKQKPVPEYTGVVIGDALPTLTNSSKTDSFNGSKLTSEQHPYGNEVKTIEEKLRDYLDIPVSTEVDFFPTINSNIYLTVKIKNPSWFEVTSFTLNDVIYSKDQFEAGSNFENVILKLNVGEFDGVKSFIIDDIKYLDGKEEKEVLYTGVKTFNLGIGFANKPMARVSNTVIESTSITFDVMVYDANNAIEKTGKILKTVIYDGKDIIHDSDLIIGSNQISVDKLPVKSIYQYAVVACIDYLDGLGMKMVILAKGTLETKDVIAINNIVSDDESISFEMEVINTEINARITGSEIYKGGTLVWFGNDLPKQTYSNLLSNNEYTIKVMYKYDLNDGKGIRNGYVTFNQSTESKLIPLLNIRDVISNSNSISFILDIIDDDEVGRISSIELYNGKTLAKSLENVTERTFTGLIANMVYTIKVKYAYDLNNGLGNQIVEEEFTYRTQAILGVNSIEILNTGNIERYEEISVNINLNNPSSVIVKKLIISGQELDITQHLDNSRKFVKYTPDFPGGLYVAKVDAIVYQYNDLTLTSVINSQVSDEIFILGSIGVESIYNGSNNIIARNQNDLITIKFSNPTGYDISWLTIYIDNRSYTIEKNELQFLDKETIIVPWKDNFIINNNTIQIGVYKYAYGLVGGDYYTKTHVAMDTETFYIVEEKEAKQLSSTNDLINIESGYIYELKNDIDLEGINWTPIKFFGAIDGNGYKIKNINIDIKDPSSSRLNVGFFESFSGIIDDLHLDNLRINVSGESTFIVGGFTGLAPGYGIIQNSSITGSITSNCEMVFAGGIVGESYRLLVKNNYLDMAINAKAKFESQVGGIAAYDHNSEIYGNIMKGSITAESIDYTFFTIGGLVGYTDGTQIVANLASPSINFKTNTNFNIGGIVGLSGRATINQNIFDGSIVLDHKGTTDIGCLGGISGSSIYSNITSNMQLAKITINANSKIKIGGILGEAFNDDVEYNLFGGKIDVSSLKTEVDIAVTTIDGYHDIDYGKTYIITGSTIKDDNISIRFIGQGVRPIDIDWSEFYTVSLKWDKSIWDYSDLDYLNGKYPVLK